MAKLSKAEILAKAKHELQLSNDFMLIAQTLHDQAVPLDEKLVDEYQRPWRDDLLIVETKAHRDFLLIQADGSLRAALRHLKHHKRLMRKARWTRG